MAMRSRATSTTATMPEQQCYSSTVYGVWIRTVTTDGHTHHGGSQAKTLGGRRHKGTARIDVLMQRCDLVAESDWR